MIANIIAAAVIILIVFLAVRSLIKKRKNGDCGCGCSHCDGCCGNDRRHCG